MNQQTPLTRHFATYTSARNNFRAVLDAASAGVVTTVVRDGDRFVVLPAEQFREQLAALRPANAKVVSEGDGWAVIIPGLPVHGDAESFGEAVDDAVGALREYAEDWNDRLRLVPNHAQHRVVVDLVELSDYAQLRDWLLGRAVSGQENADADHLLPA